MSQDAPFSHSDQRPPHFASSPNNSSNFRYTISAQQHRDIISPPPQYSSPPPAPRQLSPTAFSPVSPRSAHRSNYSRPYSPERNATTSAVREPVSPVSSYRPGSSQSRPRSRHGPSIDIPRRPVQASAGAAPPPPPLHRTSPTRDPYRPQSIVTPNMDNFSDQAQGGGLNRVAHNVAGQHPRESGMEAMRGLPPTAAANDYFAPERDYASHSGPYGQPPMNMSHGSNLPLAGFPATPGSATPAAVSPGLRNSLHSGQDIPLRDHSPPQQQHHMGPYGNYQDSPYHSTSRFHPAVGDDDINPHDIADDGDDGFLPEPKRRSFLPMNRDRSRESLGRAPVPAAGAAAAGAAMGGAMGRQSRNITPNGTYNAVALDESGASGQEKSEWLSRQTKGNNKMKWIVGTAIAIVVVLAIVGGVVGGILGSRKNNSGASHSYNSASDDYNANGDLDLNSPEIKRLMSNKNLHKVFPGIDYTPWGTQYPLCMTYPPSQNNVTRDMAVLSKLTNTVRLYGTDCNQTEMVLHAIDRLKLTDMKVWLGVWIDVNQTTTDRQFAQMYQILEQVEDRSIFKGVIAGNEALYRAGEDKSQSEQELIQYLKQVKANFTTLGYDLPVATSDLGDNWNANLAAASDYVMSNIHPFFAGTNVDNAAAWTWNFWQRVDVPLSSGQGGAKQLISETGWPSGGGTDCGNTANECAPGDTGAVASVENMNKFMADWVCQALENGTDYFWFEAFDEPWKVQYNEAGKEWEDKWGLMDPGRNLKPGLVIPDCDGKTV